MQKKTSKIKNKDKVMEQKKIRNSFITKLARINWWFLNDLEPPCSLI